MANSARRAAIGRRVPRSFAFALAALLTSACVADPPSEEAIRAQRPPPPGSTFVRGGVVVEAQGLSLRPLRSAAPPAGAPSLLGSGPGAPSLFPVPWFSGQRFVLEGDRPAVTIAAPLFPQLYPVALDDGSWASGSGLPAVGLAADGSRAVIQVAREVRVLSLPDGAELGRKVDIGAPVLFVAASPRGGNVAVGALNSRLNTYAADGLAPLWLGDLHRQIGPAGGQITAMRFVSEERLVAVVTTGERSRVVLVDVRGGPVALFPADGLVDGAGMLASGSPGDVVVGWSRREGPGGLACLSPEDLSPRWQRRLDGELTSLAAGDGGLPVLAGLADGRALVFAGARGEPIPLSPGAPLGDGPAAPILDALVTPDALYARTAPAGDGPAHPDAGKLFAWGLDGAPRWVHPAPGRGMGASADGRYLLALTDGGRAEGAHAVALFDTHAPGLDATRPVSHYRSYGPLTWLGAVSPDGLWAVVAEEGLRGAPHRAVILR